MAEVVRHRRHDERATYATVPTVAVAEGAMTAVRVAGGTAARVAVPAAGAVAAAGAIALAGWRQRALTEQGAVAATAVGAVTLARGGLPASAALVAFFATSSALSRFKEREKARRGALAQAKGGRRDAWQVVANGGVAAAALLLPAGKTRSAAFLGALAAAGADTWATELGLLARSAPRLVTTRQVVAPGTSGGVTLEGLAASAAGALTVGLAWSAADAVRCRGMTYRSRSGLPAAGAASVALVAGTLGALADSLLGATVQALYWCPVCREPVEAPVHARCCSVTQRIRGRRRIDNDAVNLLATATGAAIGLLAGVADRR